MESIRPYEVKASVNEIPSRTLKSISSEINLFSSFEEMERTFCFKSFANFYLPELAFFAKEILYRLNNDYRFVLVRELPFCFYEKNITYFLLLSLASLIGEPSYTGLVGLPKVWSVKARMDLDSNYQRTISETNHYAAIHTDSSYKEFPEKYSAMLVRFAAEDGGDSFLTDGRLIIKNLLEHKKYDKYVQILKEKIFPFNVPETFRDSKTIKVVKYPILSDSPLIRFREDAIKSGLDEEYNYSPPILLKEALDIFQNSINNTIKYEFHMNRGDLLLLNNHEILHGRTAFQDLRREILRVRIK